MTVATNNPITLPAEITEVAKDFVPKDTPDIVNMVLERKAIEVTMRTGIPSILVGHTGTAKTTLLAALHEELAWPYRSITVNGMTEVDSLIGKWVATPQDGMQYKLGIMPFCMKHGIALGVQEINFAPPEVLVLLHEYVDEGYITLMDLDPDHEDFVIHPHPNFRLYGTMNPPELYAGARELNPALARRCVIRRVGELGTEEELAVVTGRVPNIGEDVARQMVECAQSIREPFAQGRSLFYLSTADVVMWAQLCEFMHPYEAGELAVLGKCHESDYEFVQGRVRLSFAPESN